ncbi:hypothetical protein ABW20_dc0100694 [Dactylellina cionopaga]|nr:hypothetical protein ABW20_dc0100694 [Dactylellina cionopaga]
MRFGVLASAALLGLASAARNAVKDPKDDAKYAVEKGPTDMDVDELKIEVIEAVPHSECRFMSGPGTIVITLYNGVLLNDKVFDNSWDVNDPHEFQLGTPLVIQGLQIGVMDMCVGEVRKVTIPSRLAHGNKPSGSGVIPANSALIYTVKLTKIMKPVYENPLFSGETDAAPNSAQESESQTPVAEPEVVKDEL